MASDLSRFPPGSVAGLRRIGRAVGDARRERGLTQISVARAIGVSQPTISRIENGRLATVSLHRLGAIIHLLGGPMLIR
jgi:transcriptional regulator with XRE-family HTH domain